ncbi:hypothetical protein JCM19992_20700 [Thermostilla marina]
MPRASFIRKVVGLLCAFAAIWGAAISPEGRVYADDFPSLPDLVERMGVPGGLCVQLGDPENASLEELAKTGRFVVEVLTAPEDVDVKRLEKRLTDGLAGVLSEIRWSPGDPLPYTENLVNVVIVRTVVSRNQMDEIRRVLCPHGVLLAKEEFVPSQVGDGWETASATSVPSGWKAFRKPWPTGMDEWTHPRHSASGNAVSNDIFVGPPRRVRWVAGPWRELANVVTAGGRNYYAGMIARDGFNGMRLWEREIRPSPAVGGFGYRPAEGSTPPVGWEDFVFVVDDGKVCALDGRTGKVVRVLAENGSVTDLLFDQGTLFAVEQNRIRAFRPDAGDTLWVYEGSAIRLTVAGEGIVAFAQGDVKKGQKQEIVVLDAASGTVRWRRDDYPWVVRATRAVYYHGLLAFEESTFNDHGPGNALHLIAAADGSPIRDQAFLPGMNHMRQARPLFINDRLWLLEGGRGADDTREPIRIVGLSIPDGQVLSEMPGGLAHCFPPVATPRYLFSGELNLTDLTTGQMDANRITKAACGRDHGWVPAHGLIYVTPKHCVCWPMLRGYAALAPQREGGNPADRPIDELTFPVETTGEEATARDAAPETYDPRTEWPIYRHDAVRSGSTAAVVPDDLKIGWQVDLNPHSALSGPVAIDWQEDFYVKGPVSPPVVADGTVVVSLPHARAVTALDVATGQVRWRYFAEGRVDTPPTLYGGTCLFGSSDGFVHCVRLRDGRPLWRKRIAPHDERMVAFAQPESPWPVPGSVLICEDVAYIAAGRQSFADGGIFVVAFDPRSGQTIWKKRLDTIPQKGYYTSSALEFDNFDLLRQEGDGVAMSRWWFDRRSGDMQVDLWRVFSKIETDGRAVWAPQDCWSYGPRNQTRTKTYSPRRPLVAFRENVLVGLMEDRRTIYRRDFDLEHGEEFDTRWMTGWEASNNSRTGKTAWRCERLAEKATWRRDLFDAEQDSVKVDALTLTGNRIMAGTTDGNLLILDRESGDTVSSLPIESPVWDGIAVAEGRVFYVSQSGRLFCLSAENSTAK